MTKLTERQINIGAQYLVASDTGSLARYINGEGPVSQEAILKAIVRVECDHADEAIELFAKRMKDLAEFRKALTDGDAWYVKTVRENLPWLFEKEG